MNARAVCQGCTKPLPLSQLRIGMLAGGRFRLYHNARARGYPIRCGEVIVDRFPVLPPHTPPKYPRMPARACSFKRRVAEYKMLLLIWALEHGHGSIQEAADLLSMKRTTCTQMYRRLGIKKETTFTLPVRKAS